MAVCDALFHAIEGKEQEFLKVWVDICDIESPTEYKQGVDAVGHYITTLAEKKDWLIERQSQAVAGDAICITMNPESTGMPVTLSGHMDTVHPVGSFGSPVVQCDDTNIYGPGVTDCKGGIVAALLAMTALAEVGFTARPVKLILQSDEENNSTSSQKTTLDFMREKAAGSIAFLNCESTRGNTAVLWRRGIARYRLEVTGKSIHASRCNEGASAIAEAAHKILALEQMKDTKALTCNCGLIEGGTADNTVPEACTFRAEVRFNTKEEAAEADRMVHQVAETTYIAGTSCKVRKINSRCAMEKADRNFALLARMNEIYAENGLPTLTARQSLGGSDAAEITEFGIPCVDSIGVAGDYIHTPQEYGVLSSLVAAAKRIAAVVYCI